MKKISGGGVALFQRHSDISSKQAHDALRCSHYTEKTMTAANIATPVLVRCAYCAKPLTATNRAVSYELYFGTGYPARTVQGCQWCQGSTDRAPKVTA